MPKTSDTRSYAPRYAVYYAPRRTEALWKFGTSILGRDCENNTPVAPPATLLKHFPDWTERVASAARYGFHATLKAPFKLAPGHTEQSVQEALEQLTARRAPFMIDTWAVEPMGRCVALKPKSNSAALNALEADIVTNLDTFRAPLADNDRARRRPETLSERQRNNLEIWGYPFVLDDFDCHMTLTGPLNPEEQQNATTLIDAIYQSYDEPVVVSDLCLFVERQPGLPFVLLNRYAMKSV
jgi:putative phosphonate metabolism protein